MGADKNAALTDELATIGFGFVEIGTVTLRRQPTAAPVPPATAPEPTTAHRWHSLGGRCAGKTSRGCVAGAAVYGLCVRRPGAREPD
ncbi:hypothetical protein [Hymenobacter terrigena]